MRGALAITSLVLNVAFTLTAYFIGSLWYIMRTTFKFYRGKLEKNRPTHGDAKFSSWKDLKTTAHAVPAGWLVGLVDGKKVYTEAEACVLGFAPRRTGKSNMGKAQLRALAERERKPDVIVFDPHGDLRPATEKVYREAGYHVQALDFENPLKSDKHNPMSCVRSDPFHLSKDIDMMMRLIQPDDKGHSNEHFTDFPRVVMAGFVAYQLRKSPTEAKLHQIADMMISNPTERAKKFDEMMVDGGPVEKAAVSAFRGASDKERGSFQTTMTRKLAIWLRPGFIHVTGEDGWTWRDTYLNPKPVVTFITTGGSNVEGAAARLILGNAINTRLQMWPQVVAAHRGEGRPKFPKELRMLVDEARLLGNCEAITTAVTEGGKMDITLMMWWLGLRDLFEVFNEASVIANSCNIIAFGGGTEKSSYEDISWAIGEETIESAGRSEGDHGESHSANEQARRVMKSDELRRMGKDELVAVMGNIAVKGIKPTKLVGKEPNQTLVYL